MSDLRHTHPEAQPDPLRWKALALLCSAREPGLEAVAQAEPAMA